MIDILFEQRVVQNTGLAAEAIWQAVFEAYKSNGNATGVSFPLAFVVLPLTFHERTAKSLSAKTQPGALYKALAEDREIVVGLQARMQALSNRTLQAISLGFQTELLQLDRDTHWQLFPGRKTAPVVHATDDVKTIMAASKRVGQAFAEMSVAQLSTHLGIRF